MKTVPYKLILVITVCLNTSCETFLDVKPDKNLAIPTDKLENLQLLLDNVSDLNEGYPSAGILASDNIYMTTESWQAVSQFQPTSSNAYIWHTDVFNDSDNNPWTLSYHIVFQANVVLEGAEEIIPATTERAIWNNIRGSALFFRAYAFYGLLQHFSKPYDHEQTENTLGIVLRLNADINERSVRATQQESYDQLLRDLKEAASLLPVNPEYKTRPSKPAVYGLLARVYLSMSDYDRALQYADSCLSLYDTLLDYNTLDTASSKPFERYNEEVIFHNTLFSYGGFIYPYGRIDTSLYATYEDNDIRRWVFFKKHGENDIAYKGGYDGGRSPLFGGIATDEMYLIRTECLARKGEVAPAMAHLNKLLEHRYVAGSFVPKTAKNADEALSVILRERRKELVFRELRWTDLRRLNTDPRFRKTLTRNIDGQEYTLEPGGTRYVFPIPFKVIQASGIQQNE